MNLKEKFNKVQAEIVALNKSINEKLEADDYEGVADLQAKVKSLTKNLEVIKGQIEQSDATPEPMVITKAKDVDPQRLPFTGDDNPATVKSADEELDYDKAVYQMRYTSPETSVKAVLKDLYGSDYMGIRERQRHGFTSYLRTGKVRNDRDMRQIVLLPETVKNDVMAGLDVRTIKATLQEAVADLGGVLVPEDVRMDIIRRIADQTIVRGMARQITTVRDAVEWPKLEQGANSRTTSAVQMYWVEEQPNSLTETNPTFGSHRIPVATQMGTISLSKNLLEDAAVPVVGLITELFAEAGAELEDTAFVTGIGGDIPYGPLGDRSSGAEIPIAGVGDVTSSNATAGTYDSYDDWIDFIYNMPAQYRKDAVLMAGRLVHADVRKVKDLQDRPLWEPSMKSGEPATLFGLPFLETEAVPTLGTGTYSALYANYKGFVIVDRVGMSIEMVDDLASARKNQRAIVFRRRVGGGVVAPWMFQAFASGS